MEPKKNDPLQRAMQAAARDILNPMPEEPLAGPVSDEVEDLLWDYAMGLLNPPEEERVIRLLACSERAEQELAQIRQSMTEAGLPQPIVPPLRREERLRKAYMKAKEVIQALGESLWPQTAVVLHAGDRLFSQIKETILGPKVLALEPLYLGKEERSLGLAGIADEAGTQRVDLPEENGIRASIIRITADRADIDVVVSGGIIEGQVRLVRYVQKEGALAEEETGIESPLKNSRALLRDCPRDELLKIIAPDHRERRVYIMTVPPP